MRPRKERAPEAAQESGDEAAFNTTKPGSLLKGSISIRTFSDWDEGFPGFLEVDPVAYCGESTERFCLDALRGVDVAIGWVARDC